MSIAFVFILLSLAAWMPNEASAQQIAYRLAGAPIGRSNEGRLEVCYSGSWGTVCDNYFNDVAARVACRSLGYLGGGIFINNRWGPGSGPIWLDTVYCNGSEQNINNCYHRPVGEHYCGHHEDVSISCYNYTSTTAQSDATTPPDASSQGYNYQGVRLVNTYSPSSNPMVGRLEVLINGTWGTVCDDGFNDASARVACFSLGFGRIGSFKYNNYGPGTGPIWLDQVLCYGNESNIADCNHSPVGVRYCGHNEDVSISCVNASTTSPINNSTQVAVYARGWRLVDYNSPLSNPMAGRLEVLIRGIWGTVCDDGFTDASARVVCNCLGFGRIGYFNQNKYGPGSGPIYLDEVSCIGNESEISVCSHNPLGVHDCIHLEDVSISCTTAEIQTGGNTTVSPPPLNATASAPRTTSRSNLSASQGCTSNASTTSPINNSTQGYKFQGVRLVNANSPSSNPTAGRLEVQYNGVWGTVCDDGFTNISARVACFSLGFGYIGSFNYNTYGAGAGPIWLDQVSCIGYESNIAGCRHNSVGVHDCLHSEDVSISCTAPGIQAGAKSTTRLTTVTTDPLCRTSRTILATIASTVRANTTTARPSNIPPAGK